jgi:hypothetical protein
LKSILPILLVISLAACSFPASKPTATALPTATETAAAPTASATPEAVVSPFTSATYRDEANGFKLDYPVEWNNIGGEAQSRGSYVQIVSWQQQGGGISEIPAGGSLLQIALYVWDPIGDLDARIQMRRDSFLASGITMLEEGMVTLSGGATVYRILMQAADGSQSLVYLGVVGDLYLELSGSGDIAILDASMATLRIDGVTP